MSLPTFPIVGWDIGVICSQTRVVLRLLYLASADDTDPHAALMHSMTSNEARELGQALLDQALTIEEFKAARDDANDY